VTVLLIIGAVVALPLGGSMVAAGLMERAMTRCTATPPGFPRRLSQSGVTVGVKWRPLLRYWCVYDLPNGRTEKHPPPRAK